MEVKSPSPSPSPLNLNMMSSDCSTPYMSAPSSPQRPLDFFFYSAPTSPRSSSSHFFFDHVSLLQGPTSSVPFQWEHKPGVPKSSAADNSAFDGGDDFEFDFSGQLDLMIRPSLSSADELFDGGKIRPLKLPPRLHINPTNVSSDSPKSPKSPISKFRGALPPKQRKEVDPFEAALRNTRKTETPLKFDDDKDLHQIRGRKNNQSSSRSNNCRKGISRSLSPLRVSEFALHQQEFINQEQSKFQPPNSNDGSSSSRGYRKWKLKDFLLFRSASEGRASTNGKDPLRKYFLLSKKRAEDVKGSSFRSTAVVADGGGSISRRRGQQVSAHELHYTANRAVTEELKKKTSLPYKHGLLSCLGFNPVLNDISKAFGGFAS